MKLSRKTTTNGDVTLLCNGVEMAEQRDWETFLNKSFIEDLEDSLNSTLLNPDYNSQGNFIIADVYRTNNKWQLRIPVYNVETISSEMGFLYVAKERCGNWHFRLSYNRTIIEGSTEETNGLDVIRGICMSVMDSDDYMSLSREFFEDEENYFAWN